MTVGDEVTGARAEVELVVDLPIEQVWSWVTDVSRMGDSSPECVFAAWRPDQGDVPYAGARFDAQPGPYPGRAGRPAGRTARQHERHTAGDPATGARRGEGHPVTLCPVHGRKVVMSPG